MTYVFLPASATNQPSGIPTLYERQAEKPAALLLDNSQHLCYNVDRIKYHLRL